MAGPWARFNGSSAHRDGGPIVAESLFLGEVAPRIGMLTQGWRYEPVSIASDKGGSSTCTGMTVLSSKDWTSCE